MSEFPINDQDAGVFIVGCGDIGRRVARLELAAGTTVFALARSDASAQMLGESGIRAVRGDLDMPVTLKPGPIDAPLLYYFAPPPPAGRRDSRMEAWLAALNRESLPRRVVYISTSGVYGDCRGAWIDEAWPVGPQTARARRRLAAERMLQEWGERHGIPCLILRVPGIYGPGRLPLERIRQGTPVVLEQESPFSNRIHAADLAQACFLAAHREKAGGIFNVSDGHPTTMTDYFYRVADLLGLPRPPAIPLAEARRVLSRSMVSFLEESKRLDNRKMIEELGVVLRYPTLALGLPACLESNEDADR